MTRQTPDLQAVVQRLDRLERDIRWWKGLASGLFVLLGVLLLAGATGERTTQSLDEVRAGQFVLVDAKGASRASLRVGTDGSTALAFTDPDGRLLAGLVALPDGSSRLRFYDKGGKVRGGLGIQSDGTVGLALADRDGALHLWTGETDPYQVTPIRGQKVWRTITKLTTGPVKPEDYRPTDAELGSTTEGGSR